MKHSNWVIKDLNNKRKDLITYIKATTERLSEDRILSIYNIKQTDHVEVKSLWIALPENFKTSPDSLGCA